eukprot:TRINITY_DN1122_c0_g1_i3.p1 TRINITY_DN1122_c0_g1~~TRINITY_DN1122_c0_g1_i3.p1  ORF type:complete len:1140 (-),score=113.79 TRINITY_DN1122_c0_g1_i3:169-3588(-)
MIPSSSHHHHHVSMTMKMLFAFIFALLLSCISPACAVSRYFPPIDWTDSLSRATTVVNALDPTILSKIVASSNTQCAGRNQPFSQGTLNFKGMCLQDGPTGVSWGGWNSGGNTTQFPCGINAAATWDRDLMYQRGYAIGAESKALGINGIMGPGVNMGRQAAAGRNWEAFGGDPWMTGEAGALTVRGLQDAGVIAITKHYVANDQEVGRTSYNSVMDQRTFYEVYAYPFLKAVRAGTGSIMCAFNKINGTYCCGNNVAQNTILKGEFGFKGFIITDWEAGKTNEANNGMDMSMPGGGWTPANALAAYNDNTLPIGRLRDMAKRILAPYFLLKQDQNFPNFVNANPISVSTPEHGQLVKKIGTDSAVLLKNVDNFLPLVPGGPLQKIAVIGSDARGPARLNPFTFAIGIDGTLTQGWGSGSANMNYLISPLAGIRAKYGTSNVTPHVNDWDLTGAAAVARAADVAIVCIMSNSGEGAFSIEDNYGDRKNISAWLNGDNLVSTAVANNPNVVVVIHTVGPILMPWNDHPNVKAIILAGLPGGETGPSLAALLSGEVNFSGKLIYTIAERFSDYSAAVFGTQANPPVTVPYDEKLNIDYRWFDSQGITPLYEFGFGLSYTTFTYSNLVITGYANPGKNDDDTVVLFTITARITNTGTRQGAEVAQLYLGYPAALQEPPRVLRGFDKIALAPGASGTVQFTLTALDLAYWDVPAHAWMLYAGQFQVWVATSSRKIRLSGILWIGDIPTTTTAAFAATTSTQYASTTNAYSATTAVVAATTQGNLVATTSQHAVTSSQNAYSTSSANSASTSADSRSTSMRATSTSILATSTSIQATSTSAESATTSALNVATTTALHHATTTARVSPIVAATTSTTADPNKPNILWSKTGLAWPDGDAANIWALAGNGWNRVSWLYSYGSWPPPASSVAFLDFVPMLAGCNMIQDWEAAKSAGIFKNVTAVLSFYEPDDLSINHLEPDVAAGIFLQHIQPLSNSGINLGAPAVSQTARGLEWLQLFILRCKGCTINFIPVHWFGSDCISMQQYLMKVHTLFNQRYPLWVTEWACVPSSPAEIRDGVCSSGSSIENFMKCTTSWMTSQPWIQRYSYYGAMRDLGRDVPLSNSLLSLNGTTNTALGILYARDVHG